MYSPPRMSNDYMVARNINEYIRETHTSNQYGVPHQILREKYWISLLQTPSLFTHVAFGNMESNLANSTQAV